MKKKREEKGKRERKKEGFFKENYKRSWMYIKESKNFIWAVVFLFFVSAIIGFLFQPPAIINIILDYIEKILEKTGDMSSLEMVSFIFFNNLKIGFMGLIYGYLIWDGHKIRDIHLLQGENEEFYRIFC
ncbi:MAG: hypothetical protein NTZ83_03685 [Candidatus Pacearchaeota archaeon]|nr:hypothetical protein [Candidatus Pacearchaeota archaeon]